MAMTATGCFLLFAVVGMVRDVGADAGRRDSGTGGFELFAQFALPVYPKRSADNPGGESLLGGATGMDGAMVVALRVREGADASCLNLNSVPRPTVVGVDAERMQKLGAFAKPGGDGSAWELIAPASRGRRTPEGTQPIPALVGDMDTAMWGLQAKTDPVTGDILEYTNGQGQQVQLRLVGHLPHRLTLFQGMILVSMDDFARSFPETEGYKILLIDAPAEQLGELREELRATHRRKGLEIVPAVERLTRFYRVEETYLRMFLALGGIGVVFGVTGLAVLAVHSALQRRSEFGLMQAVGYPRPTVTCMALGEAAACLVAGVAVGTCVAAVSMLPGLLTGMTKPPLPAVVAVGACILANGLLWTSLAALWAMRFPLVQSLRAE
jgi:hypothetical protein